MLDQPIDSAVVELIQSGQSTIVIGPALTELAGLPSVTTLMQKPMDEIGVRAQGISAPLMAQYYCQSHTHAKALLERQLRRRLEIQSQSRDNHLLIKDLPCSTIITTNYDLLIEHALSATPSRAFRRYILDQDVETWDTTQLNLLKAWGSVDTQGSLTITESELRDYVLSKPAIAQQLKILASSTAFLFLGYSSDGYDLAWLLNLLEEEFASSSMISHLITTNGKHFGGGKLGHYPIQVTDLGTGPLQMTSFLRGLADSVKGLTVTQPTLPKDSIPINSPADMERRSIIEELINTRLGSFLSMRAETRALDNVHHYEVLAREDLLDYDVGDFYSVRRLKGTNASEGLSSGLKYSESSEVKVRFEDCAIEAVDLVTGEPLVVENLTGGELSFTQLFRIRFSYPIAPGESFDIQYKIRLPGELKALQSNGDNMSISLVRILQGVDELQFSVVLNQRPRAYWVEEVGSDSTRTVSNLRPTIEEVEGDYGIKWSRGKAFRLSCKWVSPTASAYFINYRFQ